MSVKKTKANTKLISLIGPPNSGKTTIFNYLSGQNYRTVNYPGATVEYSSSDFTIVPAELFDVSKQKDIFELSHPLPEYFELQNSTHINGNNFIFYIFFNIQTKYVIFCKSNRR